MEPFKYSFMIFAVVLGICKPGMAAHAEAISTAEAAYFEQTYDSWARNIIQGIDSKLKFTVLTKIEYTQNPEALAIFEDQKAAAHLPGLPEVQDPNYNLPIESPIYSLVSKRIIKILFYSPVTSVQEQILKEVLAAKLKLAPGDSLILELMGPASHENKKVPAPYRAAILSLFGILLLAFAFSRDKRGFIFSANRIAPPPFEDRSSKAIQQILKVNPMVLRGTLQNTNVDTIAKATLHTNPALSKLILNECSPQKLFSINQWKADHVKKTTPSDSAYARLLLAAHIQQNQTSLVLKSIDRLNEIKKIKTDIKRDLNRVQGTRASEVTT